MFIPFLDVHRNILNTHENTLQSFWER